MGVTIIAFVVIAMAIGALVGWLSGSREVPAQSRRSKALRFQLNEVVKERDANRDAVTEARCAGSVAI